MNTLTRNAMFLILLGCSVLLLPACGSKGHVNSQKPPETVLNPEGNPVSNGKEDIGMPGGKTPIVDAAELASMGFAIVLYANAALQGAIAGMQAALSELKARGVLDESSGKIVTFAERQRLVQKPFFDALARKYSSE